MRRRDGFTLTEILVVLAVLAILSGLALPVLTQVREKARQSVCAANLAQIGKAVQMYSQDWDGLLPPYLVGTTHPDLPEETRRTLSALEPYTGRAAIWFCPSDPIAGQGGLGVYADHRWSSYVFDGWKPGAPLPRMDLPDPAGRRDPSQVVFAMDDTIYMVIAMTPTGPLVPRAERPGNHREGANKLFYDGHVRFQPYPDLKAIGLGGEGEV